MSVLSRFRGYAPVDYALLMSTAAMLAAAAYLGLSTLKLKAEESSEQANVSLVKKDDASADPVLKPSKLEAVMPENLDLGRVAASNKDALEGKFLRTYRWDRAITEIEQKYGLPEGLLAGTVMQESRGDPLTLNESCDGGAGLAMFQPGTARSFGLKVYGNSRATGRDFQHGKMLEKLVAGMNWDYDKLAAVDERFDVFKSLEAAAAYLKKEFYAYGSWDKALSAYNRGTPARSPRKTSHVIKVRTYQKYYNSRKEELEALASR